MSLAGSPINVEINPATREVTFEQTPRFALTPVKLVVPFAALKSVVGNILIIECNQEQAVRSGIVPAPADAKVAGSIKPKED